MKGQAANAPRPAIRPLIIGCLCSNLSERYPPVKLEGRPPPITITEAMYAYYELLSGYLCKKKVALQKPREYPPKNLKKLAIVRYTKHGFFANRIHFCISEMGFSVLNNSVASRVASNSYESSIL